MVKRYFGCLLAVLLCGVLRAAEPVGGFVSKTQLNVRAGAGVKYTLVGKLTKNNPVKIVAANKEWLEIRVPENCGVWVMEQYIKAGKLAANVNLRSGPGTGYEALGSGKAGMKVEKMGKATASGWVMIHAPEEVHYFVSRPAIEAKPEELAKLPSIDCKQPLPDASFIELESSFSAPGKAVTMQGTLYAEETGIKGVTHILYKEKADELVPAAYLYPGKVKLAPHHEKEVTVSGTSYSVNGWELPLIVVRSVKAK